MHLHRRIDSRDRPALDRRVAAFVERLAAALPVEEVWAFGSYARGAGRAEGPALEDDLHDLSDIDLVVVGRFTEPRIHRRGEAVLALAGDLPVEPFVYTPEEWARMRAAGNPLARAVEREGRRIFRRST